MLLSTSMFYIKPYQLVQPTNYSSTYSIPENRNEIKKEKWWTKCAFVIDLIQINYTFLIDLSHDKNVTRLFLVIIEQKLQG